MKRLIKEMNRDFLDGLSGVFAVMVISTIYLTFPVSVPVILFFRCINDRK